MPGTVFYDDEGNATAIVDSSLIRKYYDPVADNVWEFGIPPSSERITLCVAQGVVISEFGYKEADQYDHSARIAYFVLNPPDDAIDIEVDLRGAVFVNDGNHRLAAAIYAARPLKAMLGGWVDAIEDMFDVKFPDQPIGASCIPV